MAEFFYFSPALISPRLACFVRAFAGAPLSEGGVARRGRGLRLRRRLAPQNAQDQRRPTILHYLRSSQEQPLPLGTSFPTRFATLDQTSWRRQSLSRFYRPPRAAISRGCPSSPRSLSASVWNSSRRPCRGSVGSLSSGSQVVAPANARTRTCWRKQKSRHGRWACGLNLLRREVPPMSTGLRGNHQGARGCSDCAAKQYVLQ